MKGYWLILGTAISDTAAQEEYGRLWQPIAQQYQAKLVPGCPAVTPRETRDMSRLMVVEFPNLAAARACYDDPAYQQAMTHALKASNRCLVMIEGDLAEAAST